jgi:S1-C subfamily serine protease
VFAIGNSVGKYQNTVTRGVVPGLGRTVNIGSESDPKPRFQNLIQTDAAINHGNSGGPLINMVGEVVGVNTLVDRSGESLGFAVPINAVKEAVNQLRISGKAARPYLGISFATIDKVLQTVRGLPVAEGAYVNSVFAGSPAAGVVRSGDIIIEVSHEKVIEKNELDTIIRRYKAGDPVLIGLIRDGQKMEITVFLAEFK